MDTLTKAKLWFCVNIFKNAPLYIDYKCFTIFPARKILKQVANFSFQQDGQILNGLKPEVDLFCGNKRL